MPTLDDRVPELPSGVLGVTEGILFPNSIGCAAAPKPPLPILQHFAYAHLPPHLQEISKPICELAHSMATKFPPGGELVAGLRKLLEAKDCLVRAARESR